MEDLDIEYFVGEIKKRPALWDFREEDHRDKNRRKRLWREVSSSVYPHYDKLSNREREIVASELQTKWKSLRTSYTRYLRALKTKGQGQNVKKYVYAPHLSFLKSVVHVRKSPFTEKLKSKIQTTAHDDNLSEYFVKEEIELNNCENDDNEEEDEDNSDNNDVFSIQNEKEVNGTENGRPYIINMFNKKINTNTEYADSTDINNCEQECTVTHETTDDDMDFFRSLLPFIKSLPLYQKISFRADIMKIAKQYADNTGRSHDAPSTESSSTSFMHSPFQQQQMYLPVLPISSLPFCNLNSNLESSIKSSTKILQVPSSKNDPNTISPSL